MKLFHWVAMYAFSGIVVFHALYRQMRWVNEPPSRTSPFGIARLPSGPTRFVAAGLPPYQ